MRKRKIRWDPINEEYWYTCPFCGEKLVLPDDCYCEHVIFGYEDVNAAPLTPPPDWIEAFLMRQPIDYLEGLKERWQFDFAPEDGADLRPVELEKLKAEAIDDYVCYHISSEDVMKVLGAKEFRGIKQHMVLARMEEDPDLGQTSFLLLDDDWEIPQLFRHPST